MRVLMLNLLTDESKEMDFDSMEDLWAWIKEQATPRLYRAYDNLGPLLTERWSDEK